jgi:hypothetical protein
MVDVEMTTNGSSTRSVSLTLVCFGFHLCFIPLTGTCCTVWDGTVVVLFALDLLLQRGSYVDGWVLYCTVCHFLSASRIPTERIWSRPVRFHGSIVVSDERVHTSSVCLTKWREVEAWYRYYSTVPYNTILALDTLDSS